MSDAGERAARAKGEGARALVATALGVALGLIAALFAKRPKGEGGEGGGGWRGRSAT